ncbi:metal ABC transporter permease [Dermacoccus abyssi]|uniref:metal ABC transporter permease n=1 Tax=Dermacoccus abyssi TaxID=322596 RepID=UPI002AD54D3C|nr:metal ABC transporter permease [Dermacoccus abyssi]
MAELFALDAMRHALVAALLVGAAAPAVGVFLVQRRLSLIGDGIGHVALAGVAVGVLFSTSPILTALIAAVLAACAIEFIRLRGTTNADVALAVMFYGGIAAGVVLLARADNAGQTSINQYLFGSILTTASDQLWQFGALALVAVGATTVLRKRLFAVANDEEYARAVGLPVVPLNLLLSILTSVTVVLSMRVIGLLLISALMILPNATGQILARSFRLTTAIAVIIGCLSGLSGVVSAYYLDTPPGGTVVLVAVGIFLAASFASAVVRSTRARHARRVTHHAHKHREGCGHPAVRHGDHVDYLHDGEYHAPHKDHWDAHAPADAAPSPRRHDVDA